MSKKEPMKLDFIRSVRSYQSSNEFQRDWLKVKNSMKKYF